MRIEDICEFGFYIVDDEGRSIKISSEDFKAISEAIKISKRLVDEE